VLFLGSAILLNFFRRNSFWTFLGKENPKKHLILALLIYKVGSLFWLYIYIYQRENIRLGISFRDAAQIARTRTHKRRSSRVDDDDDDDARASFLSFPFLPFPSLPAPLQQAMESAERGGGGGGGGSKRKKHCGGAGPNGSTTTLSATHLRYATWGGGWTGHS
jgi:hypothetical protein